MNSFGWRNGTTDVEFTASIRDRHSHSHTLAHTHTHTHTRTRTRARTHARTHTHKHTRAHTHTHTHTQNKTKQNKTKQNKTKQNNRYQPGSLEKHAYCKILAQGYFCCFSFKVKCPLKVCVKFYLKQKNVSTLHYKCNAVPGGQPSNFTTLEKLVIWCTSKSISVQIIHYGKSVLRSYSDIVLFK